MKDVIELSPRYTLVNHTSAGNSWFVENVRVTDIYREWVNQWVTVEWINANYPHFVNHILGNMNKHLSVAEFRRIYGIFRTRLYSIIYDDVYIWRMTRHSYYKSSDYKNRLWDRGMTIIPAFQSKGHWTSLTSLWLNYLYINYWVNWIYVSCDEDNEKSLGIAQKFWRRVPENDYIALDGNRKKRLVFYYPSHPRLS